MDVMNGKTGVSAAPVSVDQYFHEGEFVVDACAAKIYKYKYQRVLESGCICLTSGVAWDILSCFLEILSKCCLFV